MAVPPIFSVPLPLHQQPSLLPRSSSRKRKRHTRDSESGGPDEHDSHRVAGATTTPTVPDEYAAVISPSERAQRQVAQYSLLQDLPALPFPHAPPKSSDETTRRRWGSNRMQQQSETDTFAGSLRAQHLAAMMAVLHTCMQKGYYARASRALGLILRTDINGAPVDIRSSGSWTLGAEILLRRDAVSFQSQQRSNNGSKPKSWTVRGLENAKRYYENLIVQFPYIRSAPDSINAIDFYLAMFSLWIRIVYDEANYQMEVLGADYPDTASDAYHGKLKALTATKLRKINEIVDRMKTCRDAAPFNNNKDLQRMQAMLALWKADAINECQDFASLDPQTTHSTEAESQPKDIADAVDDLQLGDNIPEPSSEALSHAAEEARTFAKTSLKNLGIEHDCG